MTDKTESQASEAEDEPIMQWERIETDEGVVRIPANIPPSEPTSINGFSTADYDGGGPSPIIDELASMNEAGDNQPAEWFDVCRVALDRLAEAYCWLEVVEGLVPPGTDNRLAVVNARRVLVMSVMTEVGRKAWVDAVSGAAILVRAAIEEAKSGGS